MDPILQARHIRKAYGGFIALKDITFDIPRGERHALIGPNGAGKSTFIACVAGQLAGVQGQMLFKGQNITSLPPAAIAQRGIGRTFQISRAFLHMSVLENMMAAFVIAAGKWAALSGAIYRARLERAHAMLETVGLANRAADRVADLSLGDRKRLEFGMALAGDPDLLLLDEPTAGMSIKERHFLMEMVAESRGCDRQDPDLRGTRHRRGDEDRRPRHRDGAGRGAGPGHPARDQGQRRGAIRLPRRGSLMLTIRNLHAAYGKAEVLHGIELEVAQGQVVCLIGRNGVGKSSTMKAIVRDQIAVTGGEILFEGASLAGLRPHEVIRRGVGYVPEDRRVFASLSVLENLRVPRPVGAKDRRHWTVDEVFRLFPQLHDYRHRKAGVMSGGEQQMLSIARSLLTCPKLLLLDEPHEGLAPKIAEEVVDAIVALKREGVSMIVSEQALNTIRRCADRVHVIDRGMTMWSGTVDGFYADPEITRKYLMV
jgi:branched-chain amino acid transport system ATP-binding protein